MPGRIHCLPRATQESQPHASGSTAKHRPDSSERFADPKTRQKSLRRQVRREEVVGTLGHVAIARTARLQVSGASRTQVGCPVDKPHGPLVAKVWEAVRGGASEWIPIRDCRLRDALDPLSLRPFRRGVECQSKTGEL